MRSGTVEFCDMAITQKPCLLQHKSGDHNKYLVACTQIE